jgi:large subunit ribosomal protein L18
MAQNKKTTRLRRARKTRARIRIQGVPRLTVHRSGRHLYAQVISVDNTVIAAANTLQKDVSKDLGSSKNMAAAAAVGTAVAEKAKAAGIESVAFDRSGFKYHGKIKQLADAAREGGLKF